MKRINKISGRRFLTSFLCLRALIFSCFVADAKSAQQNTPDFAFPKTVSKTEGVKFEKALREKNGLDALKAAIRIDIADALVSESTFRPSAERFDTIAAALSSPWRNLALMLEAKMYSQLYRSNSWVFDRRRIPVDPLPENVMEWSGEMFRNVVRNLTLESLENPQVLEGIPLSEISGLLTDADDAVKDGFSVLDFLTVQAADVLSPFAGNRSAEIIPFGTAKVSLSQPETSELISSLIEKAIDRNIARNNLAVGSYFMKMKLNMLSGDELKKYATDCFELLKDTPYCVPFLIEYVSGLSTPDTDIVARNKYRREKYEFLSDYKKRFPDAREISLVENNIGNLLEKSVDVYFKDKVVANSSDSIRIEGANIYDFYVLIYSFPISAGNNNFSYNDLKTGSKFIDAVRVKIEGNSPDSFDRKVNIPALAPGCYAFVPSTSKDITGIIKRKEKFPLSVMTVSDLNIIDSDGNDSDNMDIFVVSATDNSPVEGASVTFIEKDNKGNKIKTFINKTDKDGKISVPRRSYDYLAEYKRDKTNGSFYYYRYGGRNSDNENSEAETRANIFTDLRIFHPGDTLRFASVIYDVTDKRRMAPKDSFEIVMKLLDANYQTVDTCILTTDRYGRLSGQFVIPESGLLGSWNLQAFDSEKFLSSIFFEVSEYKQPSFMVNVTDTESEIQTGNVLIFKGNAVTYTGMPVSNSKVGYEIEYVPFPFSRFYGQGIYTGETITDNMGNFVIDLDTSALKGTKFETGIFYITVNVTDGAGETQSSQKVRFILGNNYRVLPDIPDKINADSNDILLNVKVVDAVNHPVKKKVDFEIVSSGNIVEKGEFESPELKLNAESLSSGKYTFKFSIGNDTVSNNVVIWRSSDRIPPEKTLLWIDSTNIVSPQSARFVKIRIGSSYPDSYVLAQICNSKKIIGYKWIKIKEGFAELVVDTPSADEQIFVNLSAGRHFNRKETSVRIIPYVQTVQLEAQVETFRDHIAPGDKESWKFKFSYDDNRQPSIPVMAVMADKALNSLVDNTWQFNPFASLYWSPFARISGFNCQFVSNRFQMPSEFKYNCKASFILPDWQLYGYSLIGNNISSRRLYMKSAAGVTSTRNFAEEAVADMVVTQNVMAEGAADDSVHEDLELRNSDLAVAFFKPDLMTDSDGIAVIEFEAPNFVGTWMLNILGYTSEMKGTVLTLDAISIKKVMAELNAPRFARTGDLLSVAAMIFNNSDSEQPVTGKIEFINPLTNETIYSFSPQCVTVRPSESCVVEAEVKVPSDIESLAIRVYGEIPGYRDGEQVIIPILPSSTPVVEAVPFYIAAGESFFRMNLPKLDKNGVVTLTYCDNPVWECVTALPSLVNLESTNILSLASSLFGNCVTSGLFRKYPQLAEGVLEMARRNESDSLLISPLQRNQQLKTVLLNNTPWVNDANSETIRMLNLVKFINDDSSNEMIDGIINILDKRQNPDGGWGWCPEMNSSEWITAGVFKTLSQLENMGYLPERARALAEKASKFIEQKLSEQWIKSKRKYFSVELLLDYLYSKSRFKNIGAIPAFEPLQKEALKAVEKDWRNFDIYNKATAAMLLEYENRGKTARLILESLRQYASESPEKGMWFDNLDSGYSGMGALLTTSRVLEAFAMIEPQNPVVDKIRQWLVLSKQVENWGECTRLAEVINSILTSGTEWTSNSMHPEITLDGKKISSFNFTGVLNSFTLNLSPSEASGAVLNISRNGKGPAWGGLVSQYVAPIEDIKAASTPQLSISKNLYTVLPDNLVSSVSQENSKVGDKVRVTLTIICDRDLEYVAITDSRAACLEPVDGISGYTSSDGVWFYKEIRNSATNLFIPFLPKGTHQINYDCYIDRKGDYSIGLATAQSQYAPTITSHSAGKMIIIK